MGWVGCDEKACNARAVVFFVGLEKFVLAFCRHHGNKHEQGVVALGWEVIRERV